jgi:uncharacterized protein YbjT (DUF2867 family)
MERGRRGKGHGMELVTGATGYVGGRLIARLLAEGRPVRGLARRPEQLEAIAGVEPARGNMLSGKGLAEALDGCHTAYYLVHSMEAGSNGDFAARDRRAARTFAEAARIAGVERIVYLGGIVSPAARLSRHLASRLEVEEILLGELPRSTALRASIVVGARSPSFQLLVRLVERLRFLPFPEWRDNRTRPVDERDAIEYLARTPQRPDAAGRSLDIAGPDVLTYAEMIETIAECMGVGRTPIRLGLTQTPAASALVSSVTDLPLDLVRPLMESLEHDLLPRDEDAARIYGIEPRPFERAVNRALREWEEREPLAAR